MRKVTLAAVQGAGIIPHKYHDCLAEDFSYNPAEVANDHCLPHLEHQLKLLESCAGEGIVLALSNEDICNVSNFLLTEDKAFYSELVKISCQMAEDRLSALAVKAKMYIAACYGKHIEGKNYNLVSIFAPNGQIAGEYRKTHIPPNEMWHFADGESLNVIELDFAKVGVSICYDMMFPEAVSVPALAGAEIILHPTAGYGWYDSIGEATLRTRANDNSVYILTAKNYVTNGAGKSSVTDYWGHVLADAGFYRDVTVSETIDLDVPKTQSEWFYQSQMSGYAEIRKRYVRERRPELYDLLTTKAARLPVPDKAKREILRDRIKNGECRWS